MRSAQAYASCTGIELLAEIRSTGGTRTYLPQSRCVDWLLDCYQAFDAPAVRSIIEKSLADIGPLNLVTGERFCAILDQIELAAKVDDSFDQARTATS